MNTPLNRFAITLIAYISTVIILFGTSIEVFAREIGKLNIILVMADDQGWGQTGYNGHPHLKTPNLDAMAANGIRLDRFYAGASTCSPTRASVLTGRTPARTGVPSIGHRLCLQEKTLPQALKQAGYRTAHFGKWHLNGISGRGVPVLGDDPNHPGHYGFDYWLSATNYFDKNPLMSRMGEFIPLDGESSDLVVAHALEYIGQQNNAPFFVVIWYGSPHSPFIAEKEDIRSFPDSKGNKLANHLGEIVAIDRSIGKLRAGLRDMGIEKDTLIWYCSDNGGLTIDPDSTGPLRGNKGSNYEGGIRVPGIIEWPGRIKPIVTDFPASTMDIMPTIVDLLGLPDEAMLAVHDGESIAALFDGDTPTREGMIPFTSKKNAFIDGQYKLMPVRKSRTAKWQLFDLETDPGETVDVSGEHPERFARMVERAEKIMVSVEASRVGKDYLEGRVIQPTRKERWEEMDVYKPFFELLDKHKPGS
ncbi:MAG: sulfatase family protein [Phycisphaeraceae bacterium]